MAGDWIKMRVNLDTDPRILNIAVELECHELMVVGALWKLWAWADQHSVDGNAMSVTEALLDRLSGVNGLAAAMRNAGWIEGEDGRITMPRFGEHNGSTAKSRAQTAKRVAAHKSNNQGVVKTVTPKKRKSNGESVTTALPREEKRREDIIESKDSCPQADEESKGRGRSIPEWEMIWNRSPQKARTRSSRKQVEAAWRSTKADDRLPILRVIQALVKWCQCDDWTRDGGAYIPGLHLWIKRAQWQDPPEPLQKTDSTPEKIGGRKTSITHIDDLK